VQSRVLTSKHIICNGLHNLGPVGRWCVALGVVAYNISNDIVSSTVLLIEAKDTQFQKPLYEV
jgi:hypothetical protein